MRTVRTSILERGLKGVGSLAATSAILIAVPAKADFTVSPYVDIRQVLSDSSNRSARGSLELGAGFVAEAKTNRLTGSFAYRYGRRIEEFGNTSRLNRHNADANIRANLIDDFLELDAGGQASQYASDARGFNAFNTDEDSGNQTQVFSGYVQPRIRQRFGNFATLDANYRLSALSANGPRENANLSNSIGLDPADGLGALLSDSVTHSGGVVVAGTRGTNTLNWSLSGNATLEDIDQLNQKYRGYSGGGELGFRISRSIELIASGGYEDIENTQDSILFDNVTGLPILDSDGNLQIDPANPRRTAYDFSGEYWNVGFRFTPSRRTYVEIRAGQRYGDPNVFVNASYTSRGGLQFRGTFEQSLSSFSRLFGFYNLEGELIGASRGGGVDDFVGIRCGGGIDELGVCIDPIISSIFPATFKSDRGSLAVYKSENGFSWSTTLFFDKRRYVDSQQLQSPLTPPTTLFGADRSFGIRGRVTRRMGDNQTLSFDALLSRNDFALSDNRNDYRVLLGASYSYRLNARLSANASLFGSKRFSNTSNDITSATAAAGLRYRF